jgi:diguanylate cyclase (GGDEF)-like protein
MVMGPLTFRILLVEDSAFFAAAVRRQIEIIGGIVVDHAETLADARRLIAEHGSHYALAVLDVILLDIDFFKAVNDEYGHDVGDTVLVAVADRLRLAIRETDLIARVGGEEFGILAVNLPPEHEDAYFERLRSAISELAVPVDGKIIRITASLGVCTLPFDGLREMLHAADTALYKAKALGRNRVVRATSL